MWIIIDSEGDPVQEFSALYINEVTATIVDVFHRHVKYPFHRDEDAFARQHVHGLNRDYLSLHGLRCEEELLTAFRKWLTTHPFDAIYAHAPAKEVKFLSLPVKDVCLKPWCQRVFCDSHRVALAMKLQCVPMCNVTCHAHSDFLYWRPRRAKTLTATDKAKLQFFHHCSLYDCIECFYHLLKEK